MFEFVVFILANDFPCYLNLSLSTKFHGLFEATKTMKIGIQRETRGSALS